MSQLHHTSVLSQLPSTQGQNIPCPHHVSFLLSTCKVNMNRSLYIKCDWTSEECGAPVQCTYEQGHPPHVLTDLGICEHLSTMDMKSSSPHPANHGMCGSSTRGKHKQGSSISDTYGALSPMESTATPPASEPLGSVETLFTVVMTKAMSL